ncbi:pyridoxal-phosphate dependent enzyme, partial [Glycomyces tenuis]
VAASAGNHAQGVALAAATLGIRATVFMPAGAPLPKVAATKGYGADVILGGATVDDALESAHRFAEETGATPIHPFDHRDVVAGQGTIALEILEQLPETAAIVTAVGGG